MKKGDKVYWIRNGMVLPVVLADDYSEDTAMFIILDKDEDSKKRIAVPDELWATEKEATEKAIEFYSRAVRILEMNLKDMEAK